MAQLPVWFSEPPAERLDEPQEDAVPALLEGLNPDQRRAVTHGDGPLLVVAGAGTGKTQVITRRIAWLIATKRARPSEILALTFTDKAAEEMQVRVDQLVPYGYTDTAISTFHAFGDRLIREYALELGLPTDIRVLSRPEVVIFLREHLFDLPLERYRPLGDPTRFLGALAGLFSRAKDEDVAPSAYLAHAARLVDAARAAEVAIEAAGDEATEVDRDSAAADAEEAARQAELAAAYQRYQELLAANGFLDFGDQVSLALRLLRSSAVARRTLQARYRYILVDEFQDTNRAQAELVALLAEPHRNVTVVGDDDQSIYKFRGAAISNILDFRSRYRRARTVVLRRNYRSRRPVLDAAYRLIRFNDPDRLEVREGIVKRLMAERGDDGAVPVRVEAFATGAEEADWLAAELGRRIAAGARPADHAVLVRTNAVADPILRSLSVAGIPWRFSGTTGLYGRPEVRQLISFLRSVADPSSSTDVYALATSDVYGLGGEDLTSIVNSARRRNRSIWDVLQELERQPGILRLSQPTRAAASRLVADLGRYIDLSHERSAGEVLYAFLRGSGLLARYAAAESAAAEEAVQNVARFFDIVRAQSALLADDRTLFVARHLQTLIEAGDDPATADVDPDADAVAVLTVHKAKGLEFPVVMMIGLVAGRFPLGERGDPLPLPVELVRETLPAGDFATQEERRLFYVGMTRARDELILTYAADYGGVRARRVSPFVLEALDLPAAASRAGAGAASSRPLEKLAAFEAAAEPPETAAEPSSEPLSLSFYAIDDYLTCPRKYRYAHVLRVPLAPHHSIIYGAALHAAVQEFHKRHARGRVMSEDELVEAFERAWSSEGFLSREHEEARLAAGRAALARFRQAQLAPGAVIPAYVEREFSFGLDGDRIRGRWDRVDIERLPDQAGPAFGSGSAVSDGPTEPPAPTEGRLTGEPAMASEPGMGGDRAAPARDATGGSGERAAAAGSGPQADVVTPTLPLGIRERVTITDYKSSDVRDPARARQRARDSLQLQIYAMAYEAQTGRLPDAVQLHFLESGLVGRADVDPARLLKARERIRRAAAGIRARDFAARPDYLACSYCAFREICPESAAR
jgi:DNA helicase-2/ATP-dependent DNA helicase PcrA